MAHWPCDDTWLVDTGFACAVIGFRDNQCTFAAPILHKWFYGKSKRHCRSIINRKGWVILG